MPSIASSHLTSFLLWTFIPPFLSSFLLRIFYALLPSFRPTLPNPPTPLQHQSYVSKSNSHSKRARTTLVAGYLVWTLLSLWNNQTTPGSQSHYELLSLPRSTLSSAGSDAPQLIKSHWRKLARIHHPDKVGKLGEEKFVRMRGAVEVLEDEGRRWAYERFGNEVGGWESGLDVRTYLGKGVVGWSVFWGFMGASVVALGVLRKEERGNGFWRFLLLLLIASLELSLLLSPSPSPLFSTLLPTRETYQHIELLRQFFISSSMAISQLLPLWTQSDEPAGAKEMTNEERARMDAELLWPLVERLGALKGMMENEVRTMVGLEVRSVLPNPPHLGSAPSAIPEGEEMKENVKVIEGMKKSMVETYLDLKVKSSKQGVEVWTRAVQVGRERIRRAGGRGVGVGQEGGRRPASPSGKGEWMGRLPSPPPE
ncbi:hypothetical protein P7C70_g7835, partial [Phenoliferia sp. Uapishka_3]